MLALTALLLLAPVLLGPLFTCAGERSSASLAVSVGVAKPGADPSMAPALHST